MSLRAILLVCATLSVAQLSLGQADDLSLPASVEAGTAFQIACPGSGKGTLYVSGQGQFLKRDVDLGSPAWFAAGTLYNAGDYLVVLTSSGSSRTGSLHVTPAAKPAELTFIAKPSRLSVAQQGAITGTAYVFDTYKNLITLPLDISFELTSPSSPTQTRTVKSQNGAAWTQMDSSVHEGKATFVARVADVSSTRVVGLVPGDPCGIRFSARPSGDKLDLITDPVRDCNGNAVPDGTIVTFKMQYNGTTTSADVPLKKGVASLSVPARRGATLTAASGVVLGNQIRWE